MANDWIKMRCGLLTHPKIIRISSALKTDKFRAIGALHAVWCLFDEHAVDGILEGYSPEILDGYLGWPGFSAQMIAIGWLEHNENSLICPRFDEHNGKSAKRRAMDAERKRVGYQAEKLRNSSANDAEKKRTREEKRREEDSPSENIKRTRKFVPEIPAELLSDWMEVRKAKKVGKLTLTAWQAIEREAQKAGITPTQAITVCCEKGWAGFNADWDWKGTKQDKPHNNQPPWWSTDQTIIAKASELGLQARPGESMGEFKGRIQAKLAGSAA